jgi:dihydropteroate synthase
MLDKPMLKQWLASQQPIVMGILNVTPDSFSDGGRYLTREAALRHAQQMATEGAAIIDIGGESSQPGAKPISVQEELDRVIPIIETVHQEVALPISIDTCKSEVMQAAINAGAVLLNDINALQAPDALLVAAENQTPVCLMHKQGIPATMQHNPHYDNVVTEVQLFLQQRIQACLAAGIKKENIIIDPGFGFGKTLAHNLQIMRHLQEFTSLGFPVLVGVSRKTLLGQLLDAAVDQRLYGGIALAVWAALQGVSIIRTHDVKATVDAVKVVQAIRD